VLLTDVDGEGARAAAAKLQHLRGRVSGMALDATRPADHNAAARYAVDEFDGLDVWVNNAGIFPSQGILELTDDQWRHVESINLDGVRYGGRDAGRAMRDTGDGGCIINMSSNAGYKATSVGRAHYIAAKHGVIGLTKSVALELAPYGIRSIGLAPTFTTTEGVADRMASRPGADAADRAEQFAAALPAGRVGHPDDVARVAVFCASPLAGFVTGITPSRSTAATPRQAEAQLPIRGAAARAAARAPRKRPHRRRRPRPNERPRASTARVAPA
jgi:NAD(P)-dependent dehydrogenase (short-subunit alcohol dehydrogenase family)